LGVSRGALTFTRLFVQGKPPKDLRKRYLEAVRLRKFTPLTPEGEESEAVGWCVIERPFDLDFQLDRLFYDRFVQLGFRVDKWKIPGVLLRSQVADEEQRMLSRGRDKKLTRAEKDDIKLRVIGRLRKKILPTSRAFDVLWDLDAGTVLLFTHSARATEEFMALFETTFGLELQVDSQTRAGGQSSRRRGRRRGNRRGAGRADRARRDHALFGAGAAALDLAAPRVVQRAGGAR